MSTLWLIPILIGLAIAAYFLIFRNWGQKGGVIPGSGSDNPKSPGNDKGSGDQGGNAAI